MAIIRGTLVALVAATTALAQLEPHSFVVSRNPIDLDLLKRAPHPAVLHKPRRNAELELGGSFEVQFSDGETTATAIRAVISNATSTYTLAHDGGSTDIPFESYKAVATVVLPSELSAGAYRFSIFENTDADRADFTSSGPAAQVEVRVVEEKAAKEGPVHVQKRQVEEEEKRAIHPGGISEPSDGATLTAGESFHLSMKDGETTADQIQVILRSSGGSYTLGTAPFTDFAASGDFEVPSDAPEGSYTLEVPENASFDQGTFTDAFSVSVTVSSLGGGSDGAGSSAPADASSSTADSASSSASSFSPSASSSLASSQAFFSQPSSHLSSSSHASSAASSHPTGPASSAFSSATSSTPASALSVSRAAASSAPASPSSSSGAVPDPRRRGQKSSAMLVGVFFWLAL